MFWLKSWKWYQLIIWLGNCVVFLCTILFSQLWNGDFENPQFIGFLWDLNGVRDVRYLNSTMTLNIISFKEIFISTKTIMIIVVVIIIFCYTLVWKLSLQSFWCVCSFKMRTVNWMALKFPLISDTICLKLHNAKGTIKSSSIDIKEREKEKSGCWNFFPSLLELWLCSIF